ncbi:hypothetical protein CEXT_507241 [Caerostris extrusa]|uniref:Uncharacterized protein n=1 Tax=Caerostris extrusa TaxID=172846 RepID=A0AAV4W7I9_CAEEX|nr:hypothetical protein CEXT_507241 [Caerostris extrusa]
MCFLDAYTLVSRRQCQCEMLMSRHIYVDMRSLYSSPERVSRNNPVSRHICQSETFRDAYVDVRRLYSSPGNSIDERRLCFETLLQNALSKSASSHHD